MMSQDEIAATFRRGELERRASRRLRLIQEFKAFNQRLANEAMLADELLDDEMLAAHKAAIARVHAETLAFEKEMSPGYWKRLWAALLNR